jgi:hypothetical protein
VAGTHSTCWYARPFRIKPCLGQFTKYGSEHCVIKDGCNVLQDDELRSYHANDSDEFVKETRPCAFLDAGLLAGGGDVLARESTANNVSCSRFGFIGADVIVNRYGGPAFAEDGLAKWILLDKLHCSETAHQVFSGIREATDTAEQIKES